MKTITQLNHFAAQGGAEAGFAADSAAGGDEKAAGRDGTPETGAPSAAPANEKADAQQAETAAADGQESDGAFAARVRTAARFAVRLKAAEAVTEQWQREAEALKRRYPSFSLEESLRGDRTFGALLRAGLPVKTAYEAANLETILSAAMRYAAESARKRAAQSIGAGANRAKENPVLGRMGASHKKDVGSMTEKEILSILRQVSNGKRVTF